MLGLFADALDQLEAGFQFVLAPQFVLETLLARCVLALRLWVATTAHLFLVPTF